MARVWRCVTGDIGPVFSCIETTENEPLQGLHSAVTHTDMWENKIKTSDRTQYEYLNRFPLYFFINHLTV